MRIIFNVMNVGIGQNGGSLTIIESANTLHSLGHEVSIIDTSKNQNNWVLLKVPHIIIKRPEDIPNADVIIGTGYASWKSTIDLPNRCGKKYIWVRGFELWQVSEDVLFSVLSNKKLTILANSQCLVKKLSERGIIPWLIRPGNDFEKFTVENSRDPEHVVLGGLYNFGGKRLTKRTDWILETYNTIKKEHASGIKLIMFGCEGNPLFSDVEYYYNPGYQEKNVIYNMIDIWLATSELEGLHIPPQEAMLTECCVVGTNAPMSGTQDYLIDGITGIVAENNLPAFISAVRELIHMPNHRKEYGHEGRLRIRHLGDRTENMTNLIKKLETNI